MTKTKSILIIVICWSFILLINLINKQEDTEQTLLETPYIDEDGELYIFEDTVYNYKFESENSSWNFKKEFPGIVAWLEKKYHESESEKTRLDLEEYMIIKKCPSCKGKKLNPFALAATVQGQSIMDVSFCDLFWPRKPPAD